MLLEKAPPLLCALIGLIALNGSIRANVQGGKRLPSPVELRVSADLSEPLQIVASVSGAPTALLRSPEEGLWSVATQFADGWPAAWGHAQPTRMETVGEWTVLSGTMALPGGELQLRDAYRNEGNRIRCVRRHTWRGSEALKHCVLAIRWKAPGSRGARPLLPGISYYGNPSGGRRPERVPVHRDEPGEVSLYEEHRYPMPFAAMEFAVGSSFVAAALHTLPSAVAGGRHADQWWSLGLETTDDACELLAMSGPCATNGRKNVVKALQGGLMEYPAPWLTLRPGAVIEKTFFLQASALTAEGTGFEAPVRAALDIHRPFDLGDLPRSADILRAKLRFAESRFRDGDRPGFEMYPEHVAGTHYVMGWCGQAASPGYALLVLADRLAEPAPRAMATRALDLLAEAPFNHDGFLVRYDAETGQWQGQDPVSQGQAMENFALAIEVGRHQDDIDTAKWERFLQRACDVQSARILRDGWRPVSTNEAFLISPLLRAARLFDQKEYRRAANQAVEHYAARHLSMREPYWGGTLDATCEDKEGAWAAMQAFLAAYEDSGEERHLRWAEHAMNVLLTYVVVWDIDMPPGRLRDHGFRSRGWTAVSPQNEHLDVYGVLAAPAVHRMGQLLARDDLKRLAVVMFRSCGQLIDPFGSQGEQIQQTNYAQQGDRSNVFRLRGDYSEGWTVFWITAHFLNAAASFERMGVDLDLE